MAVETRLSSRFEKVAGNQPSPNSAFWSASADKPLRPIACANSVQNGGQACGRMRRIGTGPWLPCSGLLP